MSRSTPVINGVKKALPLSVAMRSKYQTLEIMTGQRRYVDWLLSEADTEKELGI